VFSYTYRITVLSGVGVASVFASFSIVKPLINFDHIAGGL